jgi:hypothetical protein
MEPSIYDFASNEIVLHGAEWMVAAVSAEQHFCRYIGFEHFNLNFLNCVSGA